MLTKKNNSNKNGLSDKDLKAIWNDENIELKIVKNVPMTIVKTTTISYKDMKRMISKNAYVLSKALGAFLPVEGKDKWYFYIDSRHVMKLIDEKKCSVLDHRVQVLRHKRLLQCCKLRNQAIKEFNSRIYRHLEKLETAIT